MELSILKDIVIIFALSIFVNFIFTKIKVPTVVGYLMTGIIAGPHLLGLIKSEHEIELLAEIGVILLLFTIGIEFSLKHLLKIRRIVFLGGLMQVFFTAGAFFIVSKIYGLGLQEAIFIGFIIALSSSALVLKLLQERSELTSNYGKTVLGILIFQDILLVPLLLFTNLLGEGTDHLLNDILILSLKAIFIIAFVYFGNKWLLPKLLHIIAMTRSQELFMMSIFLICLAIALLTSELGMSLAFGAFLAGLMISESEYSHNAFSNLVPFKDTFTSFFFVSIGMLLDVTFVIENYQLVLISLLLVIGLKTIIAGATGFVLGHTFRGTVLVGLALSQVGEFSFILAKVGMDYSIISDFYYQLFLCVTVITMSLTPFLVKGSHSMATLLLKLPLPDFLINGLFPLKEVAIPEMINHLVIIGKDTSAVKLSSMAKVNNIKHVSVVFDPLLSKKKMQNGDMVVYGDAVNEPILKKAFTDTASVVVISVGSLIPSMAIIEKVRLLNKDAYIIVRAKQVHDIEQLYKVGADQVLAEKLEIAVDMFKRVLFKQLYAMNDISRMLYDARVKHLGSLINKDIDDQLSIVNDFSDNTITAILVEKESTIENKSIKDINLRNITGVTILAIKRDNKTIEHPSPSVVLYRGDIVYVLGNSEQVPLAKKLFKNIAE
jgi:monovalent cation:H+ antiporter-2, CPA2 family